MLNEILVILVLSYCIRLGSALQDFRQRFCLGLLAILERSKDVYKTCIPLYNYLPHLLIKTFSLDLLHAFVSFFVGFKYLALPFCLKVPKVN